MAYTLKRAGVLAIVALTAGACGGKNTEVAALQCEDRQVALAADARAEALRGEHQLILVATGGEQAGRRVSGDLVLLAHREEYRQLRAADGTPYPDVAVPLYGTADLAIDVVGAVKMGDLMSLDPDKPGVVVLEQRRGSGGQASVGITLRLGSLANQRDVTRFDGGYAALRVNWIEDGRFGGSWSSGVTGPEAQGYFCAYAK